MVLRLITTRRKRKLTYGAQVGQTTSNVLPTSLSDDPALALDGHIVFLADRMQDYRRTRRGGLCVYVIDAWRTHSVDGQCIPDA